MKKSKSASIAKASEAVRKLADGTLFKEGWCAVDPATKKLEPPQWGGRRSFAKVDATPIKATARTETSKYDPDRELPANTQVKRTVTFLDGWNPVVTVHLIGMKFDDVHGDVDNGTAWEVDHIAYHNTLNDARRWGMDAMHIIEPGVMIFRVPPCTTKTSH